MWEKVLDELPAGVAIIGFDGKIIFVNRRILEKNKITRDSSLNPFDFIHEEDRGYALDLFKKALEGRFDEIPYPTTIRVKARDGSVHWDEVRYNCVEVDGKKLLVLVFTDVTEKIELQKKITGLNLYLKLLNRMLRHDVLNVLTSLLGYSEILKDVSEGEVAEIARKMEETVKRGIEIIERARGLDSVSDAGKSLEAIDLREAFEKVLSLYPVKYRIEGNAVVMANEGIYSVIGNIVDNAIRHGGADEIRVEIRKEGKFAEIRISDNGKGIDESIIDKIFEDGVSFGEKSGSGVGLYIVRTLVESYGGEIWAESGNGATFVIRLPISENVEVENAVYT